MRRGQCLLRKYLGVGEPTATAAATFAFQSDVAAASAGGGEACARRRRRVHRHLRRRDPGRSAGLRFWREGRMIRRKLGRRSDRSARGFTSHFSQSQIVDRSGLAGGSQWGQNMVDFWDLILTTFFIIKKFKIP